ncbi:DNA replication/repair protein RecF [Spongorhabdus nitratireducens]
MTIQTLKITSLRNLGAVELQPVKGINLLFGENGSGKSSVLEAIHLMGLARSFRSHRIKPVIQHDHSQCTVFAKVDNRSGLYSVGVSRGTEAELRVHINGSTPSGLHELAELVPLQLITPSTFSLLDGAPKLRRQFLDWGVFHVEQGFHIAWKRMQRALKQRNTLLRRGNIDRSQLSVWDAEFISASHLVDNYRADYIARFIPVWESVLAKILDVPDISLSYYRGWDRSADFSEVLAASVDRDIAQGFTQYGPQRADLRVKIGRANAADYLSRGQQKLVVSALKIAQGAFFTEESKRPCIYLIDDLPSELDKTHRRLVCELLRDLDFQVFITCVERESLADFVGAGPAKLFHVEHGNVMEYDEIQTLANCQV